MRRALGDLGKVVTHGDLVTRIWMLLLCGAMLGVMARGFHWIQRPLSDPVSHA